MQTMITEKDFTFKELEKEIFRCICGIGKELTGRILEDLDKKLKKERDRSLYRDKGLRTTSVKTVYGEVSYQRTVYKTIDEYGNKRYVFLLDENLKLDNIGQISENVAELMVSSITEMS